MMHNEVLEDLVVVKRSGQRVAFNASKVAIAIKKAFDSVGNIDDKKVFKIFEKVLSYINDNFKDRKTINVEDIQDIIENTLYNEKFYSVYNAFKEYRQKRSLSRKVFAEKQQHKFVRAIEKIEENTFNQNNYKSADEIIYDFGKIISNEYTKSYILDTKSVRATEEGNIYIHDLDYFSLGIFPKVNIKLNKKFNNENNIDLLINEIINAEREVYGEIGINNLDSLLVPYILKKFKCNFVDNLKQYFKILGFMELVNFKKIEEQITLEQNINIDLEKYNQFIVNERLRTIFESARDEAKEYVYIISDDVIVKLLSNIENRSERNTTYTISFGLDETDLGKIINLKLFDILSKNYYEKINIIIKVNNLDMDLINRIGKLFDTNRVVSIMFGKNRHIEYFADGTKVYENINSNENVSEGRPIVSSTSINLARLGLKYQNKNINEFYEDLSNMMELVKNELVLSFETIGGKCKEYYRTLFKSNIYDDEKLEAGQKIRKVIKNGVLNIGVIGLKECVTCLESNVNQRKKLIFEILEFMNQKCQSYMLDTKLNFGIFEPTSSHARKKLLEIDRAIYGTVPEVTDKTKYDLLDVGFLDNYKELANVQKAYSSGKLVTVNLTGKLSIKKVADTLDLVKNNDIEFVKMVVGKDEY